MYVLTQRLRHGTDVIYTCIIFKRGTAGWVLLDWLPNQTKVPSIFYYSPIDGEKRVALMLFFSELTRNEMHTAFSKIWTFVADSISYKDKR